MKKIIKVAISGLSIDMLFDYKIPETFEAQILEGSRVLVPFGTKTYTGIVIENFDELETDIDKIKEIISVADDKPVLTRNLIELAKWISSYYLTSLNRVLSFMIPSGTSVKSKKILKPLVDGNSLNSDEMQLLKLKKPEHYIILEFIIKSGGIPLTTIEYHFKEKKISSILNYLQKKNYIESCQETE